MKSRALRKVDQVPRIYVRFYDDDVSRELYRLAGETDILVSAVVEQACAFALGHKDFKVKPRKAKSLKIATERAQKRRERYFEKAGL